jgi:hypothetical protein
VIYVHVDDERSPTIIEPRVTHLPSGRVVLDMWRSGLHGSIDELSPDGFRLTLRDPYGSAAIVAKIDLTRGQFVLAGESSAHPLAQLDATLSSTIAKASAGQRAQRQSAAPPPTGSRKTLVGIALFLLLALVSLGLCARELP